MSPLWGGPSSKGPGGRFFCPRGADEIEVNLGSLDAPDQLRPTYELWTIRREAWLPPFPLARRYERDRDPTNRFEEQASRRLLYQVALTQFAAVIHGR